MKLVLLSVFIVPMLAFGQERNDDASDASISIHALWLPMQSGDRLFFGMQTDLNIGAKKRTRFSAGMNNYYVNFEPANHEVINTLTIGGGVSFPFRKNWFLFQPAIHAIYMKQEFDLIGDKYVRFHGGGLKAICKLGIKINQFDIGIHSDVSIAIGGTTQSVTIPHRPYYLGFSSNMGVFIKYNL